MKNLPEDEWLDWLGGRLRQVQQQPDENVWSNIERLTFAKNNSRLPKTYPQPMLILLFLFFLVVTGEQKSNPLDKLDVHSNAAHQPQEQLLFAQSRTQRSDSCHRKENIFLKERGLAQPGSKKDVTDDVADLEQTFQLTENKIFGVRGANVIVKQLISHHPIKVLSARDNNIKQVRDTLYSNRVLRVDSLKTAPVLSKSSPNRRRTIYVSAAVMPTLSYYRISPMQGDDVKLRDVNSPATLSLDRLGLKVDVNIEVPFSKKVTGYGGMSYFQQDQSISYSSQRQGEAASVVALDERTFRITPSESQSSLDYSMKNIGFQVGILYTLKPGFLNQRIGSGLIYELGVQKRSSTAENTIARGKYLFWHLVYRSDYRLNDQFAVFIQPSFIYGIRADENSVSAFEVKPYRVGISFGALFQLRNR